MVDGATVALAGIALLAVGMAFGWFRPRGRWRYLVRVSIWGTAITAFRYAGMPGARPIYALGGLCGWFLIGFGAEAASAWRRRGALW